MSEIYKSRQDINDVLTNNEEGNYSPDEKVNNLISLFNEEIKATIEKHTSSSANTFKNHLKKIVEKELRSYTDNKVKEIFNFSDKKLPNNHISPKGLSLLKFKNEMIDNIEDAASQYTSHKQLFKKAFHAQGDEYFNPLEEKNVEDLKDNIEKVVYKNKVKNYAHSFLRSYKNLLDKNSYQIFSDIYDKDYPRDFVAKEISKMKSFETSDDLNNALKKIVEKDNTPEFILEKIENEGLNVDVIKNEGNYLLVRTNDHEACRKLGSPLWCIVNNENTFNNYLFSTTSRFSDEYDEIKIQETDDGIEMYNDDDDEDFDFTTDSYLKGQQLIYYDFNKVADSPDKMIGITVSNSGEIAEACDRNNDHTLKSSIADEESKANNITNWVLSSLSNKSAYQTFEQNMANHESLSNKNQVMEIIESKDLQREVKNPLNFIVEYNKLCEQKNDSILAESLKSSKLIDLLEKSWRDMDVFKEVDKQDLLIDLATICVEQKKQNDINVSDIWKKPITSSFLDSLNEVEKQVMVKNNKEIINKAIELYAEQEEIARKAAIKLSDEKAPKRSPFLGQNDLSKTFISEVTENENINRDTKANLLFDYFIYKKENEGISEKVKEKLIENVNEGYISPSVIINHKNAFDAEIKKNVAEIINDNPENYFNSIDNRMVQQLSRDAAILDNLSEQSCISINKKIKEQGQNFGNLQHAYNDPKDNKYNFSERMAKIKEKGILDDDIIQMHYSRDKISSHKDDMEKDYLFVNQDPEPIKNRNVQRKKLS